MSRVLGLDLGRKLGWVLAGATGPMEWGTFELEDTTDLGSFLYSSDPFFREILPEAAAIAVEKPNTAGESAYFAIRKNMALLGHLHYWNRVVRRVAVNEISVMTGKLTLAGYGHADKDQMIAAAAAFGCEGMNEHEADALGIWKVHVLGAREPINRRRSRSGPVKVIQP